MLEYLQHRIAEFLGRIFQVEGKRQQENFHINLEVRIKSKFRAKQKIMENESVSNFLDDIQNIVGAHSKVLMRTVIKIK